MNRSISISRKIALAYSEVCKPLCKELGLPQTAFDILMFWGTTRTIKRPARSWRSTASRQISCRSMWKSSCRRVISRAARWRATGGRRNFSAPKRQRPSSRAGGSSRRIFSESLFAGMDEARREAFAAALAEIESNLDAILEANEP